MKQRSAEFTGRHMAIILVAFFGVVAAVNFTMARFALTTFGGIVVENSYVASQKFNGWLDQAEQSGKLGWLATPQRQSDGRVAVTLTGAPKGAQLTGMARHPLGRLPDVEMAFTPTGDGEYMSAQSLADGRWILRLEVQSGGKHWRQQAELR